MKRLSVAGALCVFMTPVCALAATTVPDWVQQAASLPLPSYPATTRAVVLLDNQVITVQADGTAITHEQRVVKILRQSGRDDAMVAVSTDVEQKLNYVHAWSIGPDGRQYTVKDSEFTTTSGYDEGLLYQSIKFRVVLPPAADPGAVIAYEFERRERPYVNEFDWDFQEDIPVLKTTFEIDLPPGWKYYAGWLRYTSIAPDEPGPGRLRWELSNVPAINTEDVPDAPSDGALVGRMMVNYSNTGLLKGSERWAGVGEWYEKLSSTQAEATPEITTKAEQLTAGESDFTQKLESITQYMQREIRYVGIEIGIGGWKPHPAGDVFRNRYGDCKDKATLLKAMLGAVGVNATWVLVDSRRGFVDPSLPSIYGDHMIAAIEVPSGYDNPVLQAMIKDDEGRRYLIFDPTDPFTPVGQLNSDLQGGYGVLVNGHESQIIQLPTLSSKANLLDRTAKFSLSEDGSLSGTVTESRIGSEAWYRREVYTDGTAKQQSDMMDSRLQRDFSSFTLQSSKAENVSQLEKPLVIEYSISAPGYGRLQGNLMLVRPRVLGTMSMRLDDKERVYPVDLSATRTERDTFNLKLPSGYAVDDMPDPVSIDAGFASYRSNVEVQGDVLRYSRELVVNQLELKPEQYAQLREFMGKVEADEESFVVLKKQ